MPSPVFEQAYLLQSLGCAIANSLWQCLLLWSFYQLTVYSDKKLSALLKYNLATSLLLGGFCWFILTLFQNYQSLKFAADGGSQWNGLSVGLTPFYFVFPYLSIVYLSLLALYAARLVANLYAGHITRTRGLSKPPIDIRLFTQKTALHLGISKKVTVWFSENIDVPSVIGFFKPVILLPVAMVNYLSIKQTEAILLHELAHIKRNDYLVNALQTIVELILFFNPFAQLLGKTIRAERENCCDDWVMNFEYSQRDYARALLVLEEQRAAPIKGFTLTATQGKKKLLQRIKRLFNSSPQTGVTPFQKIKLAGYCTAILAVILSIIPYFENNSGKAGRDISPKSNLSTTQSKQIAGENQVKKVMQAPTVALARTETTPLNGRRAKSKRKKPELPRNEDYINAYVNEELLYPTVGTTPAVSLAVDKEVKDSGLLVKVEEEQSGKPQTSIYYFELKQKDGNTNVKPLIILNKLNTKTINSKMSIRLKKLSDTLSRATTLYSRKRVTS